MRCSNGHGEHLEMALALREAKVKLRRCSHKWAFVLLGLVVVALRPDTRNAFLQEVPIFTCNLGVAGSL